MRKSGLFQIFLYFHLGFISSFKILHDDNIDATKMDYMLANLLTNNLKGNGWINLLFMGDLPDRFYEKIKHIQNMTIAHSNIQSEDEYFEDAVPYHSNVIIFSCLNYDEFKELLKKCLSSPYWHPLSNIILYFQFPCDNNLLAKIFFTIWYYKGLNTIIINENNNTHLHISYFSPYISDEYKLQHHYGCYTSRRIGMPIIDYETYFVCAESCENVTIDSVLRAKHLGTCLGIATHTFAYDDPKILTINFFEDKVKDLHGFIFKVFVIEVLPFLKIDENPDGTYELKERDGLIWNTMAELMNFKMDLSGAKEAKKRRFSYDYNVQKIFEFTDRKADLILFPVYQFDLIIAKLDNTFPFMESGVCFISYRAPFETFLFDIKIIQKLYAVMIEFALCFLCVWFVFFIYNVHENKGSRFDQIGRSYLNTVRMVLCISLYKPQKQHGFRIFLAITIWSFFLINFAMQAQIISLYSSSRRGKNVDTFEDVIEKGYLIEGIGSPDVILPDTEERYRKINEKLVGNQDMFECIHNIKNDSRRFCLMDCAVASYLELNLLNEKGEQYLHVAKRDKMHSLYLNMLLQLNSPLLDNYNKYMMALFEGGIIRKWMQYRYKVVGEELPFKSLSLEDLQGIFQVYLVLLLWSCIVFMIEVIVGYRMTLRNIFITQRKKESLFRRVFKRKQHSEISTQTSKYNTEYDYRCYEPQLKSF